MKYYHNTHIRCPFCKKLVKHLDNVETLPLNLSIFGEIVKNDPSSDIYLSSPCKQHPEKQKHYYCSYNQNHFCCIKSFIEMKNAVLLIYLIFINYIN